METKKQEEQTLAYEGFLSSLFSLLLGQCTELLKDKLKVQGEYEAILRDRNAIQLLDLIKKTTFTYAAKHVSPINARDKMKYELYALKRRPGQPEPMHDFYEVFKANLQVYREVGIELYDQVFLEEGAKLHKRTLSTATDADRLEAHERCAAMRFIRASGSKDYKAHLQKKYLNGKDVYPTTLADARAIIDNRVQLHKTTSNVDSSNATGVAFHAKGVKDASSLPSQKKG